MSEYLFSLILSQKLNNENDTHTYIYIFFFRFHVILPCKYEWLLYKIVSF